MEIPVGRVVGRSLEVILGRVPLRGLCGSGGEQENGVHMFWEAVGVKQASFLRNRSHTESRVGRGKVITSTVRSGDHKKGDD